MLLARDSDARVRDRERDHFLRFVQARVREAAPVVELSAAVFVDFVDRNDHRHSRVLHVVDRFDGLRHDAVVRRADPAEHRQNNGAAGATEAANSGTASASTLRCNEATSARQAAHPSRCAASSAGSGSRSAALRRARSRTSARTRARRSRNARVRRLEWRLAGSVVRKRVSLAALFVPLVGYAITIWLGYLGVSSVLNQPLNRFCRTKPTMPTAESVVASPMEKARTMDSPSATRPLTRWIAARRSR